MTMQALLGRAAPPALDAGRVRAPAPVGFFRGEAVDLVGGAIARQRPWSKDEAYRLAAFGFFQGQKAELLGGEIMVASSANWDPGHYMAYDRASRTA